MAILIVVAFGLAGGIVGDLIARAYILGSDYNIPFFGEINFSKGNLKGPNIIIRDAKKVIVEQNDKIEEAIISAEGSLVGIFKKKKISFPPAGEAGAREKAGAKPERFNLADYYQLDMAVAQGFILTSDGWIVTSFKPENLDYVIITRDKKIYTIDKAVSDKLTPFHFLHVRAKDLTVRQFVNMDEIKNGQIALSVNWNNKTVTTAIAGRQDKSGNILNFSDSFFSRISLMDALGKEFAGSFLFNLSGDVIGLIDKNGAVWPISHFSSAIKSLFQDGVVKRPSLGVNYIDLSRLVSEKNSYKNGALIYKSAKGIAVVKGGAADGSGLAAGDIIVSVDGQEINEGNNLTDVIQSFLAGDRINIVYLRDGEEKEVEVELGEVDR